MLLMEDRLHIFYDESEKRYYRTTELASLCQGCKFLHRSATNDAFSMKYLNRRDGQDEHHAIFCGCMRGRPCYKCLSYTDRLLEELLGVYPEPGNNKVDAGEPK